MSKRSHGFAGVKIQKTLLSVYILSLSICKAGPDRGILRLAHSVYKDAKDAYCSSSSTTALSTFFTRFRRLASIHRTPAAHSLSTTPTKSNSLNLTPTFPLNLPNTSNLTPPPPTLPPPPPPPPPPPQLMGGCVTGLPCNVRWCNRPQPSSSFKLCKPASLLLCR